MLVSILIPCFNAERWIGQAIESALTQTYADTEIVVIDDGSKDGSLEIIRLYKGRIRYETGPNRGSNYTRNRLLSLARGKWLQYLDADDFLLPSKISAQMKHISEQPAIDVVFGPVILEDWLGSQVTRRKMAIPNPCDIWVLLASWQLPQTGSPLWRRQALIDVGGWNPEQPCCQEHELYLRLLMAGKRFSYCEAAGAVYRHWSTETVCHRNVPEVHRQRLEIKRSLEHHLRSHGALTPERQTAINQSRFEVARLVWQYAPSFACEIASTIHASQVHFSPAGPAAPFLYRTIYRLVGFDLTETVADWRRRIYKKAA